MTEVRRFKIGDRIQVRGTIVQFQGTDQVMVRVDGDASGVVAVPMRIIDHADRIITGTVEDNG